MYLLKTTIEISATPEAVRQKFLDFPQIPKYHPNGFFKSIEPIHPDKPIEAGDKIIAVIELGRMEPTVLENSPRCFRWIGGLPLGIFNGDHSFHFEPSSETRGGTTFVQQEQFTGLLSFLMGGGLLARSVGTADKTKRGFEGYNTDLKAWCESDK